MAILTLTSADAGKTIPVSGSLDWDVYGTDAADTIEVAAGASAIVRGGAGTDVVKLLGGSADYTVKLSGSSVVFTHTSTGKTVTVPVTSAGDSVSFGNGTAVTLKSTTTPGTPTVVTLGAQTISATDAAVTGATGTATGSTPTTAGQAFTLTASDVTITEPAQVTAGTNTTANMTFTVTLSAAQTTATVVNYATSTATGDLAVANSDYTTTNGSLTIPAGATSATFTVPVIGDGVFDGTVANPTAQEKFTVTLSSPTSAFATSTVKGIINDLQTNSVPVNTVPSVAADVLMGTSGEVKNISVADANNNTLTVELTASNGVMSLTGTGTVASVAGKATATLSGSKADINATLATLTYASDRTIAGTDTITIKTTDGFGGVDTDTVTVNVVPGNSFTANNDDFAGTTGNDIFMGVGTSTNGPGTQTFNDANDKAKGGEGNDTVKLIEVVAADLTGTSGVFDLIENFDITTDKNAAITAVIDVNAFTGDDGKNITFTDGDGTALVANSDSLAIDKAVEGTVLTINSSLTSLDLEMAATGSTATVNLSGGVTISDLVSGGTNEAKTLNINSNGSAANKITTVDATTPIEAAGTINIGGSADLSITFENSDINLIDGSNATGKLTINGAAINTDAAGNGATFKGGSAADAITGATVKSTIEGGAGNDTITGGAAADSLVGGAGDDSLTGAGGADTLTGGLGKDTYVVDGSDTVVITAGDTGSTAATRDVVSGIIEGTKISLTGYASDFATTFGLAAGATLATSATDAAKREIYIDQTNKVIVIEMDAAGTVTEQISIGTAAAASVTHTAGVLTFGAVPMTAYISGSSVVVEGQSPNAATTVTADLSVAYPQVYVTGGTATNVPGASTSYANLDLSKLVGATGTVVTGSSVSNKIIGSILADTITGGAGADNMDGGAGDDTFVVAAIADFAAGEVVTGGANADILKFGAAGTITYVGHTVTGVETLDLTAGATNAVVVTQGTGLTTVLDLGVAGATLTLNQGTTAFDVTVQATAGAVDVAGEWHYAAGADNSVLTYFDQTANAAVAITLTGVETGALTGSVATNVAGNLVFTQA